MLLLRQFIIYLKKNKEKVFRKNLKGIILLLINQIFVMKKLSLSQYKVCTSRHTGFNDTGLISLSCPETEPIEVETNILQIL